MLADFLRDFPDDEACLQWLCRQRYSPDGTHTLRERCEAESAFRGYETKQQRQKLDVHSLCPSRAPDSGDDLSQVVHVAAPLVLRDVHHGQHSLWHLCQAT